MKMEWNGYGKERVKVVRVERRGELHEITDLSVCIQLEGDFDAVMEVVRKCHEALAADCNRIACTIKMDYRKGHDNMLKSKIESVEKLVGRRLKT